ncbi:hypothetical protein OBBRIDRAFT_886527 [Obba rivulosa]|uniref:Uncharacterized protein n=1 Tax=Obba rivulosa TaxID=1052685 RepID=A0A8E2DMG2_9APHY|nr:hypothetical protein OBBRIDRAFT_886527 [Obba rivulosa]
MANWLIDPARFGMPQDGFDPSGGGYYCHFCDSRLTGRCWSQLHRHITTQKHMSKLEPHLREELEQLMREWQRCPYCRQDLPIGISRRQHIEMAHPGCKLVPEREFTEGTSARIPSVDFTALQGQELISGIMKRLAENGVSSDVQHAQWTNPPNPSPDFTGLEGERLVQAVLEHIMKAGDMSEVAK